MLSFVRENRWHQVFWRSIMMATKNIIILVANTNICTRLLKIIMNLTADFTLFLIFFDSDNLPLLKIFSEIKLAKC
jgi:hypothetical protein